MAVLLHGLGNDASAFSSLQDHLEGRLRSVSYTRRAAVNRPGPCALGPLLAELDEVLDALGPQQPVVVVGHSWGGALARAAAVRRPDRVLGTVLVDATDEGLAGVRRLAFRGLTSAAHLAARYRFSAPDRAQAVRELAGVPASLRGLGRPGGPVLVVVGTRAGSRRQHRVRADMLSTHTRLAQQQPGTRLVEVAEAGHHVAKDAPALLAGLIHQLAADSVRADAHERIPS